MSEDISTPDTDFIEDALDLSERCVRAAERLDVVMNDPTLPLETRLILLEAYSVMRLTGTVNRHLVETVVDYREVTGRLL